LVFGKIEYLNLLPFHVFMKRHAKSTRESMSARYKKGVPAKINADFAARRVDAAFISSVNAKKRRRIPLGIVARKEVLSVLLIPAETRSDDSESATSNKLARVLGAQGKVLIGDKALRYYLSGKEAVDLAQLWHERYHLPFVFAVLCHHGHRDQMKRLSNSFLRGKVKIPRYLLKEAASRTQISEKEILHYLQFISYRIDTKAEKGLRKFWYLAKRA
jgi:chorismate dehydratase